MLRGEVVHYRDCTVCCGEMSFYAVRAQPTLISCGSREKTQSNIVDLTISLSAVKAKPRLISCRGCREKHQSNIISLSWTDVCTLVEKVEKVEK